MKRISNPPNPWASGHVEWIGEPPEAELTIFEQQARSILAENQSPDIPFRYSLNPYRGCYHGCAYCYARPSHQHLDFGAGTDFERKIVVKTNAPELLQKTFEKPSWRGETIAFSGNTDCYQPLEATYELTRRCLQICARYRNPVAIITKGSLVRRDVDVLAELAESGAVMAWVSIPFDNDADGKAIEPHASIITQRLKTVRVLADAGIEVGVAVAPMIPGLNDFQIPEILECAADAGASRAFMQMLRLPAEVGPVFEERLRASFPDRADRVFSAMEEMRGGKRNEAKFGDRMRGKGPRWEMIRTLFETQCRRFGLNQERAKPAESTFRRPNEQISLF